MHHIPFIQLIQFHLFLSIYNEAYTLREGGRLCDIAPTLIEIMGMEKPAEMTGESLLIKIIHR